jgi:hypothetical protein
VSEKLKGALLGIAVTVIAGVLVAIASSLWQSLLAPFDFEVDASYIDATGSHPAAGATLTFSVEPPAVTDAGGRAYWKDIAPHWTEKHEIEVDPPYQVVSSPPFFVRRYPNPINIVLKKIVASGPVNADAPVVHFNNPIEQEQAEHLAQVQPANPAVLPAPQENPPLPDRTEIYRSGPQISGPGKEFSQWYTLCSGDIPGPGYTVKSSTFQLAGDRQCGAWAVCQKTTDEPTRVCWQFKLQGHDEQIGLFHGFIPNGQSGRAFSEGILSVLWTKSSH